MQEQLISVRISEDEMTAYFQLAEPDKSKEYKKIEVENEIRSQHVVYGVNHEQLASMVDNCVYNHLVEIAQGTSKVDGKDGYYEYLFDTELNCKPQMNEDGTINYRNLHLIELVQKGQVIVEVHEPEEGIDGFTVTGKRIAARRGRPVPPLKGKGFEKLPDSQNYFAAITGKVEKVNEKVFVTEIYEISGDVDMKTGNIEFNGDVVIHGNVNAGMTVKATGTITIDGTVESAIIKAGKDVIIRGGFIGGYKGLIETDRNLYAKFMEFGTIRVEREIHTDSILNCHVTCYDKIIMEGKRASIIGGYVYAAGGIDVYSIGNINGADTKIVVGIEKMHLQEIMDLAKEVEDNTALVKKIDATIVQLDKYISLQGKTPDLMEKKNSVLRSKIKAQTDAKVAKMHLDNLNAIKLRAIDAKVRAIRDIYRGSSITIGTENVKVKEDLKSVEFVLRGGKLITHSLL